MTRYELHQLQDLLIDHHVDQIVYDQLTKLPKPDFRAQKVSDDLTLDDISTVLSDGLSYALAFDDVDYDSSDYFEAKDKLIKEGADENELTVEDIQAKMLVMGFKLKLHEVDVGWHDLTLEKFINGINLSLKEFEDKGMTRLGAISRLLDEGDFYDYEGVLQNAIFGKVIYG
jgi:hypothetical protein